MNAPVAFWPCTVARIHGSATVTACAMADTEKTVDNTKEQILLKDMRTP
jgi:hypothetical protein